MTKCKVATSRSRTKFSVLEANSLWYFGLLVFIPLPLPTERFTKKYPLNYYPQIQWILFIPLWGPPHHTICFKNSKIVATSYHSPLASFNFPGVGQILCRKTHIFGKFPCFPRLEKWTSKFPVSWQLWNVQTFIILYAYLLLQLTISQIAKLNTAHVFTETWKKLFLDIWM